VTFSDKATRSRLRGGADILGAACVLAALVYYASRGAHLQWDAKIYLAAARAARAGLDPYVLTHLTLAPGRPAALPFLYPPVALSPFLLLAQLPVPRALALWMTLHAALLVGLVVVWRRFFMPRVPWSALALVALFGSNAAALWDLRAGNVALVEALLLWTAFACFAAGRRRAFAALVVAASVFKLAPAVFLLLLLVPTARAKARPLLFAGALVGLCALVGGPFLIGPAAAWRGFLANLPSGFPVGDANPSAWAAIESGARAFVADAAWRERIVPLAWAAYAAALLAASAPWLRGAWRAGDPVRWTMGATVLYLLLAPRPMAYGFVLAGAPLLYFAPGVFRRGGGALAFAALVSAQGLLAALSMPFGGAFGLYGAFLVLAGVWAVVLAGPPSVAESDALAGAVQDARPSARSRVRAAA